MNIAAFAQALTLPSETLPNRIAKAAMTEGLADARGYASAELIHLYKTWAAGGAGLLITGNVQIDAQHLERPGNIVIAGTQDNDARTALKAWSEAGRSFGAGLWMQLSHAGRQTPALVNPTPKAPSAVPLALPGKLYGRPQPMTEADILQVVRRFAEAAAVARETGFTGVQIHAAHGYLISQFLSPLANRRTDAWGGSLENRTRLLIEVVHATRARVGPDFTIAVKLNSADFQKGGFAPGESLVVAEWLAREGVDVIEISGGNYEQPRMMKLEGLQKPDLAGLPPSTAKREAYFLDFAIELRQRIAVPLMVTGGMRSARAMEDAIAKDGIALIGIARPMVTQCDAPRRLLEGAQVLDCHEDRLRLGPGFMGPRSPLTLVRAINGFGALYWQYQQLRLLAKGHDPRLKMGLLEALLAERRCQQQDMARYAPQTG